MGKSVTTTIPLWTIGLPLAAVLLLALKTLHIIPADAGLVLIAAALLLGATVFSAVHHAETVALKLGEPYGSILLAVAVTVIEVALIVSIMLSGAPGATEVARDTVFSAVMIVLNGIVGLCLILGAGRYHEQSFRLDGAAAALAVLGTLATLTLVLPNFTMATRDASYSPLQLGVVGAASLVLYLTFVFVQTARHRDYFLQDQEDDPHAHLEPPSDRITAASVVLLVVSLVAVVLLAKVLTKPIDQLVMSAGLPKAFVGVVIATVVLLPEGIAALKAALSNRLQNSLNLALGSALASIGLTIPVVAGVSIVTGSTLTLGLSAENMVLLVLSLFVGTLTLGTGRTTVLQGTIHLVIFAVFLLISAVP